MSVDNVIRPASFAAQPVTNPKTRGRPKGTTSLGVERRRRSAVETQKSPYHPSVAIRPIEKGRFHYPKELLLQEGTCRNSYGWMLPGLSPSTLGNQRADKSSSKFISPLNQLLEQLEAEGHDVEGARLELSAMREVITAYDDISRQLMVVRPTKTGEALARASWNIDFDGYR